MKSHLAILIFLAFCRFSTVTAFGNFNNTVTKHLRFETTGPADSSIQPFSIEIGRMTETNRDVIFVTKDTYDNIFTLVTRAGSAAPRSTRTAIMFQMTSYLGNKHSKPYTVYPATTFLVMRKLRTMFEYNHHKTPGFITAIERLFTVSKTPDERAG